LQHTRIAVAFACWSFLLFWSLKTMKKVPEGKCDSYTRRMFSATTYCRTDQYCPSFYNQLMLTILAGNTDFWFVSKQNFIALGEIDPLNRRHSTDKRPDVVVQGMFLYFNSVLVSHATVCFSVVWLGRLIIWRKVVWDRRVELPWLSRRFIHFSANS